MQQCIRLRLHGHTKSLVSKYQPDILLWNEWMNVLWGGCRWAQTSQTSQPADKRQPTCSAAASRPCRRRWSQSHADHWLESPFPNLWRKKERQSHIQQLDGFCHWNLTRSLCWNQLWHALHYSLWAQTQQGWGQEVTHSHSLLCLLILSAAMPPCGAAGYMEGILVVMKSAICCRANRLVGVFPFFSWSWIIVSSSSQKAWRAVDTDTTNKQKTTKQTN